MPELVVPDLSTGWAGCAWIERHVAMPFGTGPKEYRPFLLTPGDQMPFLVRFYGVKPTATVGQKAAAFTYRRSQLVRAQKQGKSPFVAAVCCLEGMGPTVFDGFAQRDDEYRCEWHGCPCGWRYRYEVGEPMAVPRLDANIQLTATSADQTGNTYDALRPMIEKGPLAKIVPAVRNEFVRLPTGGEIAVVTSKARSRLGQRITFVVHDESQLYWKSNGMEDVADTQKRGLAGMGGRSMETTNPWDPAENSVAQQTYESTAADILRDFEPPPAHLKFRVAAQRRKILEFNYRHAPWVDIDDIEGLCLELMAKDPGQAERFFGCRIVRGMGAWLPDGLWENLAATAAAA